MNPLPKPNYTNTTVARNFSAEVKRVTSYKYISYGQEDPKFLREHSYLEIRLPSAVTTKLAGTPVFLIINPANDPVDDSSQLLSELPTISRDRPTCIHLVKTAQGTQTEPHELEVSDVGEEIIDRKPRIVSVDQATQSLPPQSSTKSSQTNRPFQSSSITQTDHSFLSSSTTQSASIQTEAVSIQTEAVSTQTEVLVNIIPPSSPLPPKTAQTFLLPPPTTLSAVQDSLLTLLTIKASLEASLPSSSTSSQLPISSVLPVTAAVAVDPKPLVDAIQQPQFSSSASTTIAASGSTSNNPIELDDEIQPARKCRRVMKKKSASSSMSDQQPSTSSSEGKAPIQLFDKKPDSTAKIINCRRCNFAHHRDDLIEHILTTHATNFDLQCPLNCGATVPENQRMAHVLRHFGLFFLQCNKCNRTFMKERSYQSHFAKCFPKN